MGGGFPAAAFGGRADVMGMLSPDGPVYQAGTLSGNPVATTAGLATLRLATDEVYAAHRRRGEHPLGRGRRAADPGRRTPRGAGRRQHVQRLPRPRTAPVRDFAGACAQDTGGLQGVLPRDARPGRLPAAERLRGVVPLRRPRRPGAPARPRRPARCAEPPRPQASTARLRSAELSEDDRPPAAPRRGAQPAGHPLRALDRASTSPSAAARWPTASPTGSATATSPTWSSSPLERAQETAAPLAAARGLTVELDERVIESGNIFEGKPFDLRDSILRQPEVWRSLWNPFRPSWGEPYKEVVARMWPAVLDAREAAAGHEARGRLPPAADLDHPAARRGAPLPARPAQAALHAVQPHLVHLRGRASWSASATPSPPAT